MRILFIGAKDRGVRCLQALLKDEQDVVGVITSESSDPDAFWTGSVFELAIDRGLEILTPDNINAKDFLERVEGLDPDLIVMSGFSQILGADILEIPNEGVLNLHAGKLPEYRGGSPMNWAIINGETEGTATIHYATEKIDSGPIVAEEAFEISIHDTIADVRNRTLEIFPRLLIDVVHDIENGEVTAHSQEPPSGTYWGSRMPSDGEIDWSNMSAKNVYDFVRALTHPYPGAFTTYNSKRLYIWEASLLEEDIKHSPGRVLMRRGEGRVVCATDRSLVIETVQFEGGEKQSADKVLQRGDFLK